MDQIILVDYDNNQIGEGEKIDVHQRGLLHRAFSVFLFDGEKVLLQKRNSAKYHSGGKIANSCCSHPRNGELLLEAASRRLSEELGIKAPKLDDVGYIIYRADFGTGIVEYEYDHILVGDYRGPVDPNPEEIDTVFWIEIEDLLKDITTNPDKYAVWFISALTIALNYRKNE